MKKSNNKFLSGSVLASAVAGLFLAGMAGTVQAHEGHDHTATTTGVKCVGANACKGHSVCAVKGGHDCKAQNSCKGKGLTLEKDKAECEKKGGKVAES